MNNYLFGGPAAPDHWPDNQDTDDGDWSGWHGDNR